MSTKIQRVKFDIPEGLTREQRTALGEALIEQMRKNAESGKGRSFDNKAIRDGLIDAYTKFPKYSKGYIKSLDFKNAGKSQSKVDLTLSGDLLQSMQVVSNKPDQITIGFPDDQQGKADGNIRGTYGKDSPDSSKARNFLGLTETDFNKIVKKFT